MYTIVIRINKMEHNYPITREQLRNYNSIQKELLKKAFITRGVEYISNEIIATAQIKYKTSCEFIIDEIIQKCCHRQTDIYMAVRDGPFDTYLERIMLQLKERFPDCSFTQDPSRKYLFIDWS